MAKRGQTGTLKVVGTRVGSRFADGAYAQEAGVTSPLVTDCTREVTKGYCILNDRFRVAHRPTFVIDKQDIIRHASREDVALDPTHAHAACSRLEHGRAEGSGR